MAGNATSPIIPAILVSWVQLLVPGKCFDEFFIDFNFLHLPCLKLVLSKTLGCGIILGAVVVKLPQVMKILKAKSGQGISMPSVVFEMIAICSTLLYSVRKGFPFSSYGEAFFLAVQTGAIGMMVQYFQGSVLNAVIFLLSFTLSSGFFMSSIAPMSWLVLLQTGNIFIIIASKLIQAVANFRNGCTGQLSVVTVVMVTLGSLARIFTSIQETGDRLIITSYVVSTLFNLLIALQVAYYWNVPVGDAAHPATAGKKPSVGKTSAKKDAKKKL